MCRSISSKHILIVLIFTLVSTVSYAAQTPPNIVLILADDLPWYGTSAKMEAGNEASNTNYQNTPNIDTLARQGITFSHAYATSPICGPSRANIQLGTSTVRSRYTANAGDNTAKMSKTQRAEKEAPGINNNNSKFLLHEPISLIDLPEDKTALAEYLGDENKLGAGNSYKSAHFGKWHAWGGGPEAHGFNKSDGETSNSEGKTHDIPNNRDPKRMFSITENAVQFMTDQTEKNQPFFVQLSHYVAHKKYDALNKTIKKYMPLVEGALGKQLGLKSKKAKSEYATRLAMMEDFDGTIGMVLSTIKDLGIENNTYVIFTADNGRAWETDTNNLRGDKWWLFEAGLRVPLIIKGPNIPKNERSDVNISHFDLYPTFIDWAGGNVNKLKNIDGISIKNLLENPSIEPVFAERNLYFHYPHYRNSSPHTAVINNQFKLIMFYEHLMTSNSPESGYHLFNLRNGNQRNKFGGQREKSNRFEYRPEIAYQMEQDFRQYLGSVTSLPNNYTLPSENLNSDNSLRPINVDKVMPAITNN